MRFRDPVLASRLRNQLDLFERETPLPGIERAVERDCFIGQLVDSVRRISFYSVVESRGVSPDRANPASASYDPVRGAMHQKLAGNFEEAFWLAFLSVHFGRNRRTGWQLCKDIYGELGSGSIWNWERIRLHLEDFLEWLDENEVILSNRGKFGNHRKYESLSATKARGTGAAITSYLDWVGDSHVGKFETVNEGDDGRLLFDQLYRSMSKVVTFGRTAKFDYLTTVGKLGLINIEPGKTYLGGATGPVLGARLLFGGSTSSNISRKDLEVLLLDLEQVLSLPFGMQVLEDSLCNWQKSPAHYVYFNG